MNEAPLVDKESAIDVTPIEPVEETPTDSNETVMTYTQLNQMMKHARELVLIMEGQWEQFKTEFSITEDQVVQVIEYNNTWLESQPEVLSTIEENFNNSSSEEYDPFVGLDTIPTEKVIEIFGVGSPIIGLDQQHTVSRLKDAAGFIYNLYRAYSEFRKIEDEVVNLMDEQEIISLNAIREVAANDPDPNKREKAQLSVDAYLSNKHLTFLCEIPEEKIKHLVTTFYDPRRINYVLHRGREYLGKIKPHISEKFILEISKFEERFLDIKYHKQNNILLLYFLQTLVYDNVLSNNETRKKVMAMVIGLDKFVRMKWSDDEREIVKANIVAFEDKFIDRISNVSNSFPDEIIENMDVPETTTNTDELNELINNIAKVDVAVTGDALVDSVADLTEEVDPTLVDDMEEVSEDDIDAMFGNDMPSEDII